MKENLGTARHKREFCMIKLVLTDFVNEGKT